jgi:hypothetical protein
MRDDKPVPKPGDAARDDNELHYYEVDETNVGDADRPEKPLADHPERPDAYES